jgi:GlpG protein
MRQVGSIDNERQAQLFADYLVSEGISAHAEPEDGEWAIWVRDENHVPGAAEQLRAFVANPADQRYRGVSRRAEEVRQETARRRSETRQKMIEMRTQWNRGLARRAPLVVLLIAASVLVTIVTNFGDRQSGVTRRMTISDFRPLGKDRISHPPDLFRQIKRGEVWRLVTPAFVHFNLIHLAFNMYMLYYLGSQIENRFGTLWFGLLVLVMAVGSNAAQAYLGQTVQSDILGRGPLFGGMSGVDYGLFGYIWMKTLYDPQAGLYVSQGTVFVLLAWFFLCFTPIMAVANGAHAGGFAIGLAFGYAPELSRRARRR